ncbi:N-acetylglucosaminyltransferas-like protein [Lineolata rhizophorae]|uniref:N-acetylglucosaminyltransferas-like protein n=1 Tax=Lineolata rhizophorae TaxID=578093 RepID=A0A6A6P0K0_9PEZI|nr:N-acetylglucosaminyltransferas-like protein [Lineolata rhizophorae]
MADTKGPSDSKDFTVTIDEVAYESESTSPTPSLPPHPPPRPNLLERCSLFIQEWTPFTLVLSYFIFSTCLYTICSEGLIAVFWFVYMATNFYIASMTVFEAFLSIIPCREARKAVSKLEASGWKFPTKDDELLILDIIIVAYLPNEKDIIMDRAFYALDKIEYPRDKLRINIVYNTPYPIEPLETELHQLAAKYSELRVIRVPNSKSKADNLNYFFTLNTGSDVIAIYDCDHYMHPHGPRWAIERFKKDPKVDIVQGRCVVFNSGENFLTSMISVEFDKIYAVSHPGRAKQWGFGLFCGSNGYWRTSLIKDLKMDESMLTEDIDSALRAVSRGAKTVHDLNVVSYELAPTNFQSFWKQRLRWAQGWTQASIRHLELSYKRVRMEGLERNFRVRFGLISLLLIREWSYYLVTQYTCLVLSFLITKFPSTVAELARLVYFQYPVSQWLLIVSIVCLLATLWITNRAKSEFATPWMIVVFSLLYPVYLIINATIGLYGHARQVINYSSWNPTARS